MKLVAIIKAVQSLNTTDQQRLLDFFTTNLEPFLTSEPIFNDIRERKNADGYTFPYCSSKKVVCFGKYMVKVGSKDVERQRYRCKDCKKTFTDTTNTPLYRVRKGHLMVQFVQGYSLRKSAKMIGGISHVSLFYYRH